MLSSVLFCGFFQVAEDEVDLNEDEVSFKISLLFVIF